MDLWLSDRVRLLALLSFCALLWSAESLVPLFRYREGRLRRALPNLALALGLVMTNMALASITAAVSVFVTQHRLGLLAGMRARPWMLAGLGILGLDLAAYLAHLLLHKIPVGWNFHRVHHSEPEVDVTTAFRQHPGETVWRVLWQCLTTAVLELPLWVFAIYLILSSLNALLEHANLRVSARLDWWLRLLVVTPNMHKIHHSREVVESDSNYSNIFSVWDRVWGTYTARTNPRSIRYGLDGFDNPGCQRLAGLLKMPFRSS